MHKRFSRQKLVLTAAILGVTVGTILAPSYAAHWAALGAVINMDWLWFD